MVVLHWKPADFWAATPHEVMAAVEMFQEMNPPVG